MDTRKQVVMLFNEGKTWDKVKKVWRDHKGKIIAAGALGVAAAGGMAIKKKRDKVKTNIHSSTTKQKIAHYIHQKKLIGVDKLLKISKDDLKYNKNLTPKQQADAKKRIANLQIKKNQYAEDYKKARKELTSDK